MPIENFTSLDPSQEQTFVVYEQKAQSVMSKAKRLGIVSAVIIGLLFVANVLLHDAPEPIMSDTDMAPLRSDTANAAAGNK